MEAVDQAELAARLHGQRIPDTLAVGLPQPLLVGEFVAPAFHVFARRDPDPGQQRIGQYHLTDALTEIIDGGAIVLLRVDAVFAFGAPGEDVPSEDVGLDAAVVRVLHDVPPEPDLLVDG